MSSQSFPVSYDVPDRRAIIVSDKKSFWSPRRGSSGSLLISFVVIKLLVVVDILIAPLYLSGLEAKTNHLGYVVFAGFGLIVMTLVYHLGILKGFLMLLLTCCTIATFAALFFGFVTLMNSIGL